LEKLVLVFYRTVHYKAPVLEGIARSFPEVFRLDSLLNHYGLS